MNSNFDVSRTPELPKGYNEIPARRKECLIGKSKYQVRVIRHQEKDLGFGNRLLKGIGLLILTAGTVFLALLSNTVRDSWSEVFYGKSIKYIKFPISDLDQRTSSSAGNLLKTKFFSDKMGLWMTQNNTILDKQRPLVAEAYWKLRQSDQAHDHSNFINFLKNFPDIPKGFGEQVQKALNDNDFKKFRDLFEHLNLEHLYLIDDAEKLNAMPVVAFTDKPVEITEQFLKELREYMLDSNFSGVVTISDGKSQYTISLDNIEQTDVPFAIHSVGKIFTGVLLLRLIEEGIISEEILNQPIQLSEAVLKSLPQAVRDQLNNTTLHEVMLHRGRYGDYLSNYLSAIEKSIKEGSPLPEITNPNDFLAYADDKLIPKEHLSPEGEYYSNLGLLLVGLSIEHLYNQHVGMHEQLNYSEILKKYVLDPSGMKTFATSMPEGSRFNKEDLMAPHIAGGPAGGYWSTSGDLMKFGTWLGAKLQEKRFQELILSYGGEFYNDKNKELSHGGSIDSSSAYLSHHLQSNVTIAVLSDMTGSSQAAKLAHNIQERLLKK